LGKFKIFVRERGIDFEIAVTHGEEPGRLTPQDYQNAQQNIKEMQLLLESERLLQFVGDLVLRAAFKSRS